MSIACRFNGCDVTNFEYREVRDWLLEAGYDMYPTGIDWNGLSQEVILDTKVSLKMTGDIKTQIGCKHDESI